eukprot:TRINITY_DN11060_c0_g1_i4.p1 TRINITY_DN11060_c0_g1~~TRINITY_DN11060_c0_g1_i4.p1  ORF type:complete len:355 (-),score=49.54 TRINITY_DN11060_c0_g1_i4:27-1091(-)
MKKYSPGSIWERTAFIGTKKAVEQIPDTVSTGQNLIVWQSASEEKLCGFKDADLYDRVIICLRGNSPGYGRFDSHLAPLVNNVDEDGVFVLFMGANDKENFASMTGLDPFLADLSDSGRVLFWEDLSGSNPDTKLVALQSRILSEERRSSFDDPEIYFPRNKRKSKELFTFTRSQCVTVLGLLMLLVAFLLYLFWQVKTEDMIRASEERTRLDELAKEQLRLEELRRKIEVGTGQIQEMLHRHEHKEIHDRYHRLVCRLRDWESKHTSLEVLDLKIEQLNNDVIVQREIVNKLATSDTYHETQRHAEEVKLMELEQQLDSLRNIKSGWVEVTTNLSNIPKNQRVVGTDFQCPVA